MSAVGKVAPSLMLLMCLVHSSYSFWANEWDRPLHFTCPKGQILQKIYSEHSNSKEDRRWNYGCNSSPVLTDTCDWTNGHVNQWDQPMLFECPKNGVVTGFSSHHSNSKEDRIWKIRCCQLKVKILAENCEEFGKKWRDYANYWDHPMNFQISGRRGITGVFSVHSNYHEDRRWRFKVCSGSSA